MAIQELDLDHDLNMHLLGSEDATNDGFRVDSQDKADWALRTIREHQKRIEQVKEFAQKRIDEIHVWADKVTESEQRSIEWLTSQLEAYHRQLFHENPRLKTIKLPAGQLQLRKASTQYARDDQRLTRWLKEHKPELVRVKETPDWAAAKRVFAVVGRHLVDPETGEIVDGVEVNEPSEPTFNVKVSEV